MEHAEAVKEMMAERYLLDELQPDARDAFEEHYFGCEECAAAVRDGSRLMDGGRSLARLPRPKRLHAPRPVWWSAAVAALAVFVILTQFPGRQSHAPAAATSAGEMLMLSEVRSADASAKSITAKPGQDILLGYEVLAEDQFVGYRAEVRDEAGRVRYSVAPRDPKALLSMRVPAGTLIAGQYKLVVSGERADGTAEVVAQPQFRVRFP